MYLIISLGQCLSVQWSNQNQLFQHVVSCWQKDQVKKTYEHIAHESYNQSIAIENYNSRLILLIFSFRDHSSRKFRLCVVFGFRDESKVKLKTSNFRVMICICIYLDQFKMTLVCCATFSLLASNPPHWTEPAWGPKNKSTGIVSKIIESTWTLLFYLIQTNWKF